VGQQQRLPKWVLIEEVQTPLLNQQALLLQLNGHHCSRKKRAELASIMMRQFSQKKNS